MVKIYLRYSMAMIFSSVRSMRYEAKMPAVKFRKVALINQKVNSIAIEQAAINGVEMIDRPQIEQMLLKYTITDCELDEFLMGSIN